MDLRRARIQDWLTGALGAVLVVSLFLEWYRACATPGCGSGPVASAWSAFAAVDVILALAGLSAIAALVLTLVQRAPALPLALTSLGVIVTAVALVLVLIRLIAAPTIAGGESGAGTALLFGAWVGAGVTAGLLAAMLASIRDERTAAPPRSVEEQTAAVRTLNLSGATGDRPGSRGPSQAT